MKSCVTRIQKFSAKMVFSQEYRTGVSLHSHTMHSKEFLGRLPTYIAKVPVGSYILEREIGRSHPVHRADLRFQQIFLDATAIPARSS